ncbi:hypothetical protein M2273_000014 [Mucilaginibacter lappiensis]
MRILYVSNNIIDDDIVRNALGALAERDSIYFVHDFTEAENFITTFLVGQQQSLDLIICHNKIFQEVALDFKNKLIVDTLRTYSNRDFNLHKIPIVVLIGAAENRRMFSRQGFSDVLTDLGTENIHKYITKFKNPIKIWRKGVLDELDNLGIKFNSGIIDYSYYFTRVRKFVNTHILSENFQQIPRRLDYYWLIQNQRQIEMAIDEFVTLLKRTHRLNKKREEKLYHKFFNRNKSFLLRDNYSRSWYEMELPLSATKSLEPDYSLKPNMNYETDLSILEVKLPNESFVKQRAFHPTLYSKLIDHLGQVNDYKDYLESDQYQEILKQKYGWVPEKIEYKLLIGRQDDKEEHRDILEKRMRHFGQTNIYLMTYDELRDYQVKFLERINLLEVR